MCLSHQPNSAVVNIVSVRLFGSGQNQQSLFTRRYQILSNVFSCIFLSFFSDFLHPNMLHVCECFAHRCVCAPPMCSAQGSQKNTLGPRNRQLLAAVCVLGIKPRFSGRAAGAPHRRAIPLALLFPLTERFLPLSYKLVFLFPLFEQLLQSLQQMVPVNPRSLSNNT